MDIRVLRYFLAVAREESFSRAAEALHLSQPTLSRQIRDMEDELGAALFVRTSRNVLLTREGLWLRKRAEELVDLLEKTRAEFPNGEDVVRGDVYIGCGETHVMRAIATIAVELRREYPGIHYHLHSGNADDVSERLDKGLLDFGILIEPANVRRYDSLRIPGRDVWGLLMPRDHPLALQKDIAPDDLAGIPLLISRQSMVSGGISGWLGKDLDQLNVVATYNLVFNAAMMVEQGMGCALCLDHLVNTMDQNGLCFRPLTPKLDVGLSLVWTRHQVFSPAAELFLQRVRRAFAGEV